MIVRPRDHVAEDALQRDADAESRHPDAGDQGCDLETELVERDDQREQQDHHSHDPHHEPAHRWLERHAGERTLDHRAHPPGDDEPDDQDDDRAHDLEPVADREVQDQLLSGHARLPVMGEGRESRSIDQRSLAISAPC